MVAVAKYARIAHTVYELPFKNVPAPDAVRNHLQADPSITHMAMVHCETTTGILNPLREIAALAKEYGKIFIVDAMSSFGGIPLNIKELNISFLVSSANKCVQGVPGFSFVIAKTSELEKCEGKARSLCLDLFDQWRVMRQDGKWRFTSPTHAVAAFAQALDELRQEGGVKARYKRYKSNNALLRKRLAALNIEAYIADEAQSPIITTFLYPRDDFNFSAFYEYVKKRGFILYPGKLTAVNTFRIGNIGEINRADIEELCAVIKKYLKGKN
jgi:2-aminoethylphosphonate-pyruvate transaminase